MTRPKWEPPPVHDRRWYANVLFRLNQNKYVSNLLFKDVNHCDCLTNHTTEVPKSKGVTRQQIVHQYKKSNVDFGRRESSLC